MYGTAERVLTVMALIKCLVPLLRNDVEQFGHQIKGVGSFSETWLQDWVRGAPQADAEEELTKRG